MYKDQKVVVVLPAYNAEMTLADTIAEVPIKIVDELVLCDDASTDNTLEKARELGIQHILKHDQNKGYGANQKTLYNEALRLGADIVIMLHPDYQYSPKLIEPMVRLIGDGVYPVVLGSRILGGGALKGGMPRYKYIANRILTFVQNLLIGSKLSEFHTGYRAYRRDVLDEINLAANSDDFVFDNQVLSQIHMKGFDIGEVSCPTKYFDEASSINFSRSVKYGLGVLTTSVMHAMQNWGIARFKIYE